MVLNQKLVMAEGSLAIAPVLYEVKHALRELRRSSPDSFLVKLAEQKLAMMERDFWLDRDLRDVGLNGGERDD